MSPPTPPPPPLPPRSAKQLLELGLAQTQRGEFEAAMANLQQACRLSRHGGEQFKAQRALVSLYRQTQQTQEAIALCQDLSQHSHPKVRAWADEKLGQLTSISEEPPPLRSLGVCSPRRQPRRPSPRPTGTLQPAPQQPEPHRLRGTRISL